MAIQEILYINEKKEVTEQGWSGVNLTWASGEG
jgi:hypothetical protein